MAITINWATKVINVPKADMTLVSSSPFDVFELDVDTFRKALNDLQDDVDGIVFDTTHLHSPPVTLGGVEFARQVEIINGYTITFENDSYAVNFVGGNNNFADVVNLNLVQTRSANSGGLVQTTTSGLTGTESAMLQFIVDALEGDHDLSPLLAIIRHKTTKAELVRKDVAKTATTVTLTEPV